MNATIQTTEDSSGLTEAILMTMAQNIRDHVITAVQQTIAIHADADGKVVAADLIRRIDTLRSAR